MRLASRWGSRRETAEPPREPLRSDCGAIAERLRSDCGAIAEQLQRITMRAALCSSSAGLRRSPTAARNALASLAVLALLAALPTALAGCKRSDRSRQAAADAGSAAAE